MLSAVHNVVLICLILFIPCVNRVAEIRPLLIWKRPGGHSRAILLLCTHYSIRVIILIRSISVIRNTMYLFES